MDKSKGEPVISVKTTTASKDRVSENRALLNECRLIFWSCYTQGMQFCISVPTERAYFFVESIYYFSGPKLASQSGSHFFPIHGSIQVFNRSRAGTWSGLLLRQAATAWWQGKLGSDVEFLKDKGSSRANVYAVLRAAAEGGEIHIYPSMKESKYH